MPRRKMASWLLTTCDSDASFAAALASGADFVILDVGAAPGAQVRQWLSAPRERAPRVAVKLGEAIEDDLDAFIPGAPWAIFAPCRSGADVQRLGGKLGVREARFGLADGATRIVASVGDALGILNLSSFVGASPRLAALACDARGLRENLSAPQARIAPSLARGLVVLAAAAAGVDAIDGPAGACVSRAEAESAREDGFSGMIVRNPEEVAVVNGVFASGE